MQHAKRYHEEFGDPAMNAVAVTPSDSGELGAYVPKGIWVGGSGTLSVEMFENGAVVSLGTVPGGTFLPICPRQVRATGTTATNIVAFW